MVERDQDLLLLMQALARVSEETAPDDRQEWEWRRDQGWDAIGKVVRFLEHKGLRMNMELVPLTRIYQALRDLDRGVVPDVLRPAERETSARPRSRRFDHIVGATLVAVQILRDSGFGSDAPGIVAQAFAREGHLTWTKQPLTSRAVLGWWNARDAKWSVSGWRAAYQSQRHAFAATESYPLSRDRADWAVRKLASHPVLQNDGYLAS